jgi:hypothetical protein
MSSSARARLRTFARGPGPQGKAGPRQPYPDKPPSRGVGGGVGNGPRDLRTAGRGDPSPHERPVPGEARRGCAFGLCLAEMQIVRREAGDIAEGHGVVGVDGASLRRPPQRSEAFPLCRPALAAPAFEVTERGRQVRRRAGASRDERTPQNRPSRPRLRAPHCRRLGSCLAMSCRLASAASAAFWVHAAEMALAAAGQARKVVVGRECVQQKVENPAWSVALFMTRRPHPQDTAHVARDGGWRD